MVRKNIQQVPITWSWLWANYWIISFTRMTALGHDIHGQKPTQKHNLHWLHSMPQWYPQVLNRVHSGLQNAVPEFICDKAEAGAAKWPAQTFRCKRMGNTEDGLGSLISHTDQDSSQGQDSFLDQPAEFLSLLPWPAIMFKIFLYILRLLLSYCMYGSTSA